MYSPYEVRKHASAAPAGPAPTTRNSVSGMSSSVISVDSLWLVPLEMSGASWTPLLLIEGVILKPEKIVIWEL